MPDALPTLLHRPPVGGSMVPWGGKWRKFYRVWQICRVIISLINIFTLKQFRFVLALHPTHLKWMFWVCKHHMALRVNRSGNIWHNSISIHVKNSQQTRNRRKLLQLDKEQLKPTNIVLHGEDSVFTLKSETRQTSFSYRLGGKSLQSICQIKEFCPEKSKVTRKTTKK